MCAAVHRVVRVCAIMTMNDSSWQTPVAVEAAARLRPPGRAFHLPSETRLSRRAGPSHRAKSGVAARARARGASHFLRHLAQLEFLHLAGGGLGQFRDHGVARSFVAREVLAAPGDEVVRARVLARLELDEGARGLAPF